MWFRPKEPAGKVRGHSKKQVDVIKLADVAKAVKDELTSAGIASWSIQLEGDVKAGTGALPGVEVGFKAALTISSK